MVVVDRAAMVAMEMEEVNMFEDRTLLIETISIIDSGRIRHTFPSS